MALLTSTAIAISAGVAAATAGGSFIQAGIERRRQDAAEREAKKAFNESKATLDTLYAQERSVQKEKFELEREAGVSGLNQILEAGQSGERGVGEIAGRANVYNQQRQATARVAMGQEMTGIDAAVIAEKQAVRNAKVNIGLAEAQGQQMIAADARQAKAAANKAGVQGLVDAGQKAMQIPGLYGSSDGVNVKGLEVGTGGNSFENVFGSVTSTPYNPNFDPNSVEVAEIFDPIFDGQDYRQ